MTAGFSIFSEVGVMCSGTVFSCPGGLKFRAGLSVMSVNTSLFHLMQFGNLCASKTVIGSSQWYDSGEYCGLAALWLAVGPGLKYWPRDRQHYRDLSWFPSDSPSRCRNSTENQAIVAWSCYPIHYLLILSFGAVYWYELWKCSWINQE
jgi:hypothetical protein